MPGDQGASLAGTAHYVLAQYRAQLQEVFTHFCDGQSTLCRRGFLSFASAFDLAGARASDPRAPNPCGAARPVARG